MKEARAYKYGRFRAEQLNYFISHNVSEEEQEEYRKRFLREFRKYSFEPRKTGTPKNSGCVRELDDLENFDIGPETVARLEKESMHLTYLKQTTSRRIFCGFIDHFQ